MHIDIRGIGLKLSAPLAAHADRRLRFALGRHSMRIARVTMRLGDENGPRGGEDKYCRVQVRLREADPVDVEDIGGDLYAIIDRASDSAGRAVARQIERGRRNLRVESLRRSFAGFSPADAAVEHNPPPITERRQG
jgi:putative sigma-54 modulation protein